MEEILSRIFCHLKKEHKMSYYRLTISGTTRFDPSLTERIQVLEERVFRYHAENKKHAEEIAEELITCNTIDPDFEPQIELRKFKGEV
jgi:hypothetical protein